uniref:(northern house mosquito) hypothetical protein n=1 Tax=Culex pipiens TaxID=7175 RepID=A0A8D8A8Y1_CULPI
MQDDRCEKSNDTFVQLRYALCGVGIVFCLFKNRLTQLQGGPKLDEGRTHTIAFGGCVAFYKELVFCTRRSTAVGEDPQSADEVEERGSGGRRRQRVALVMTKWRRLDEELDRVVVFDTEVGRRVSRETGVRGQHWC